MKRLLPIIFMLFAASLFAQSPEQQMQRGNESYAAGNYEAAISAYESVLKSGHHSADLYYNLGNAYYRQEEIGQAILNYERALRLKPNFRDARQNLELANSKAEDEIAILPELFIARWARALVSWFSFLGWKIVILVLTLLGFASLALVLLSRSYAWRRGGLISAFVIVGLFLISWVCAIAADIQSSRHNTAIVTQPLIVVKSSPENTGTELLVLHEGTKVAIDETLGEWHKIHIADGNSGWVPTQEITII